MHYRLLVCLCVSAIALEFSEAAGDLSDRSLVCKEFGYGMEYCTESGVLISVKDNNSGSVPSSTCLEGFKIPEEYINCNRHHNSVVGIFLTDENISAIAPNAFGNSTITKLILRLTQTQLQLTNESFNGLPMLESLLIESSTVSLSENPFKKLKSLRFLSLKIDEFKENFHGAFSENSELKTLIISNTHLEMIYPEFFFNIQPAITYLDLQRSEILRVAPKTFISFKYLETLKINVLHLSAIKPKSFDGLAHLTKLTIKSNEPSIVPKNIFNELVLKTLNLKSSFIEDMEDSPFSMSNVTILNLSNNNISKLEPSYFTGLVRLETLELNNNQITSIPKNTINSIVGLKNIKLQNNLITIIEPTAFEGLKLDYLDLSHNLLTVIKADGSFHFKTAFLDLSYNPIEKIETNAWKKCSISSRFYLSVVKITKQDMKRSGLSKRTKLSFC